MTKIFGDEIEMESGEIGFLEWKGIRVDLGLEAEEDMEDERGRKGREVVVKSFLLDVILSFLKMVSTNDFDFIIHWICFPLQEIYFFK